VVENKWTPKPSAKGWRWYSHYFREPENYKRTRKNHTTHQIWSHAWRQ